MNSPSTLGQAIALILSWLDEDENAADSQLVEGQRSAAEGTTQNESAQRVKHTTPRRRGQAEVTQ